MTDVRALLHDLAAEAPRGHGEETADRVVDLHRAQDRRRLRLAGAAIAVAAVVVAVPALVTRSAPPDPAAVTAAGVDRATSLFDVPPRGSLAADEDLVAAARAASWDDGTGLDDAGDILDPALADRRVVFTGVVPGGQVWALVVARTGTQLAYAWFVDVDPADGIDLQLAAQPGRAAAGFPLALLDTAGDQGVMVVVALPDQGITFASDPAVVPAGAADGVAWAEVTTTGDAAPPLYRLTGPASDLVGSSVTEFDSSQPLGQFWVPVSVPVLPSVDPDDGAAFVDCMAGQGWQLSLSPDGTPSYALMLPLPDLADIENSGRTCAAALAAGD